LAGSGHGRTSTEAINALVDPAQRAMSTVARGVLTGRSSRVADQEHLLQVGDQGGVRLGGDARFMFRPRVWYRLHQPDPGDRAWTAAVVGYDYRIWHDGGADILVYHWHPTGRSPIAFSHLHVGGHAGLVDLSKAHLPTGLVSLVAVIRMTITEFGVEPLRDDWRAVLDRAETELGG